MKAVELLRRELSGVSGEPGGRFVASFRICGHVVHLVVVARTDSVLDVSAAAFSSSGSPVRMVSVRVDASRDSRKAVDQVLEVVASLAKQVCSERSPVAI
ncbi:MAG: hypothetical protein QXX12_00015 [Nanopusillaceae archaeon]